ncbi:hypothetical protein GH714_012527 [Hevea brasiliensis]|uniref:Myb-like domain-containing protein n=1 Tax=Hevea brasiliensis TaxID=3981 RepID=A0A6A6MM91_HEVBR|nr:hypothetical protein GH714_012527 [Hevea brasiliensis]
MIHKRRFVDDDSYEVACKHPRHLEHIEQLAPIAPPNDSHQKAVISDGDDSLCNCQDVGSSANDLVTVVSNDPNNLESEYFDHGHQLRALMQPDEVFSSLDYPFRKPVSIGPGHQAFVPEWEGPNTSSNKLDKSNPQVVLASSSSPSVIVDDGYEERLIGICVIPMPDLEASVTHYCGGTRTDCSCLDLGSIGCVKQHIVEARQKLRESLGEEIFEGLGFYDMGEDVANKWTEEEEQVFHNVVLSNPPSLGRNFWDHLAAAFPSRTKGEIFNYYFNVFMLRRRSEQNRFDPLNIDSDNDEWQRNEAGMAEEDEDSGVESLNGQDGIAYYQEGHAENCSEPIEDDDEIGASRESAAADDVQRVATDEEYEGDLDDISEAHVGISTDDCGGDVGFKLFRGISCNKGMILISKTVHAHHMSVRGTMLIPVVHLIL